MQIVDIKDMPGYEYRVGFKGDNSVSEGKIHLDTASNGKIYPHCAKHGAINSRAVRRDGTLWRCSELGCDEGCFMKIIQND